MKTAKGLINDLIELTNENFNEKIARIRYEVENGVYFFLIHKGIGFSCLSSSDL